MKFKCKICPAEFKTERGLANHKHRCKACGSTFKSDKGYESHVSEKCRVLNADKHAAAEAERIRKMLDEALALEKVLEEKGLILEQYKIGESVFVSKYFVSKSTHEWRGNRHVRVRYEEERIYSSRAATIIGYERIGWSDVYRMNHALITGEPVYRKPITDIGPAYRITGIFGTMDEAWKASTEQMKKYKEQCDHASMCR